MLWETNPTNLKFEKFLLYLFVSEGVRFMLFFLQKQNFQ